MISAIDLAYPQILRTLTNTLFTKNGATILHALGPIAIGLFLMYVLQSLCKYYVSCQGHMMGARMERICANNYSINTNGYLFPIMTSTIPVK